MITTNGLITEVKFGDAKKANIIVSANRGKLTLRQAVTEKQIGDHVEDSDKLDLPKIEMEFFNVESIDILIGALECIKKNATPPPNYGWLKYYLAC